MTKVEELHIAFKENPNRLTYNYQRLQDQFNATYEEVKMAKEQVRQGISPFCDEVHTTPEVLNSPEYTLTTYTYRTDKDGNISVDLQDNEYLEDPNDLLRLVNLNPEEFEVTSFWRGFRANGKWWASVKAKPRTEERDMLQAFKDHLEQYEAPKYYEYSFFAGHREKMAVVCLFDVHLGKLGLSNYTGDRDITVDEIAEEFDKLWWFLNGQRVTKILLPIGNDFFNADNPKLSITKGIVMDNDPDMYKIYKQGLNLIRYMIERLATIAPVEVVLVAGNHATYTETLMAASISAIFKEHLQVKVDDQPKDRKYIKFGKVLLGLTHGVNKPEKYANLLPYEAKEHFSSCDHFEILVGDKHHEKVYKNPVHEIDGVVVRQLGALSRTDRWHNEKGFTLAKRRSYVLIYDAEHGIELQYTNNAS